ncbi:MAG: zinc-binding alcohol dehydrogenase family protein [Cryobacterium sp.]|uniref:quinone oxidoreductase family protein n=1 Tax=unclassified Cryobacterium TaxID=2649013 RepID=UPI0018CA8983|nr:MULTISPECIES: zinc-binding alcohol dehydrogenase family protein [unclassified Cryobacterium]MCY7403914.1 zinc-binding alcohol dehydrogenase family protein [Cryobacterium sp.]MEC5153700.1 NADPH2:quinone reductase [Cryobacterium sp. CAN_C3]
MKVLEITQPGGADVVRFAERAEPTPGPGQLLIEVEYAGLNFTDVLARRGVAGYSTGWPFVPGMEVAGRVVRLGDDVTAFAVGDSVLSFTPTGGGLAERAVADAALTALVPDGIDLAAATTIPLTWATAVGLVQRSCAAPAESILITSVAGGVGGALTVVLSGHDPRIIVGGLGSTAKSVGAGVVAVERSIRFFDEAAAVAGGPFDVIFESVGGDVAAEALLHLAPGGRLVTYGAAAGDADPASPPLSALRSRNNAIIGFSILSLSRSNAAATLMLITKALDLTAHGLVIPRPNILHWNQAIEGHLRQSEGRATGKSVVRVSAPGSAHE